MRVLYSPQVNEQDTLNYEFVGDKITVTYNGEVDIFDFTGMPNGCSISSYDRNDVGIKSDLPIDPIIKAEKVNGVLQVELINFIGLDATEEERFPDWIEVNS